MRNWILPVVVAVLGSATGLGLTWLDYCQGPGEFALLPPKETKAGSPGEVEGEPKAVVVNGLEFDFGTLEHEQKGEHTFVIRNDGTAPLNLSLGGVTCGQCIQTEFASETAQPGATVDIKIEYALRKPGPEFLERIELSTNDPQQQILALTVRGYVSHAVRASVQELTLGDISGDEETTASLRVYGYLSDHLEILSQEFVNAESSGLYQIQSRKLDPPDYADESHARGAYELTVTIKPGLPLGPINQTIRLALQAKEKATIDVPIQGRVVSDISLVGSNRLQSDGSTLYLGTIPRSQGAKFSLRVLVKGPHRESVQVKIGKADPGDVLQASLGEVSRIAEGRVHMYPLTVEVIKNAPAINRLGTDQGKAGLVVIETTHPTAKQVNLRVRFATE